MKWKNNINQFGFIAIILHWLVALTVVSLFTLGWWMTELDYYDSWYKLAPWWHKSVGVLLFLVVLFRLIWRIISPPPKPIATHKLREIKIAYWIHLLLYGLLIITMFSGYLISTADNRGIDVFDWFTIPATITIIESQEDVAGLVHFIIASLLISVVLLHILAALKHQFIDRDGSLKRMLGGKYLFLKQEKL